MPRGPRATMSPGSIDHRPDLRDAVVLLDQLADRWSVETSDATARISFEIDRHQTPLIATRRRERNAGALQW